MAIDKLSEGSSSATLTLPHNEQDDPSDADSHWFSAALQSSLDEPVTGNFAEHLIDPLVHRASALDDLSKQAGKALREASLESDPMKFMKLGETLSEYSLQTSLSVKVISKGAQALEKLTNMQ